MPRRKIDRSSRGNHYSAVLKARVLKALQKGLNVREASAKFGPSIYVIKDWKKAAGLSRAYTKRDAATTEATSYSSTVTSLYVTAASICSDTDALLAAIGFGPANQQKRYLVSLARNQLETAVALLIRAADA